MKRTRKQNRPERPRASLRRHLRRMNRKTRTGFVFFTITMSGKTIEFPPASHTHHHLATERTDNANH